MRKIINSCVFLSFLFAPCQMIWANGFETHITANIQSTSDPKAQEVIQSQGVQNEQNPPQYDGRAQEKIKPLRIYHGPYISPRQNPRDVSLQHPANLSNDKRQLNGGAVTSPQSQSPQQASISSTTETKEPVTSTPRVLGGDVQRVKAIITERKNEEGQFQTRLRHEQESTSERDFHKGLSQQQSAFRIRQRYDRETQAREYNDVEARDRELRYLIWRENQLTPYTWREQGRICRYVTHYKTAVKINRRATVCEFRRGRYTCFHPWRYYIYPITRVICYPEAGRLRARIRPY